MSWTRTAAEKAIAHAQSNANLRVGFVTMTEKRGRHFMLVVRTLLAEQGVKASGSGNVVQLPNGSTIRFSAIDEETEPAA